MISIFNRAQLPPLFDPARRDSLCQALDQAGIEYTVKTVDLPFRPKLRQPGAGRHSATPDGAELVLPGICEKIRLGGRPTAPLTQSPNIRCIFRPV